MFKNKKIHMIGIGGISMSGIAILLNKHNIITGSDQKNSKIISKLEAVGINIIIGYDLKLIEDADIIIYTAAINEDNPELVLAKKLNKEIYERSIALGMISKDYKNCLCVAGTHGKSTSTGLLSLVFLEADYNPTIQIGAMLNEINGNIKIGNDEYLIIEACEYVDSFLHFYPTATIITNIDNDHLDYFKNLDNIKKSFKKYTELLPQNGYLVINNDDENSQELLNNKTNIITYGINNEADFIAKNIIFNNSGLPTYDIYKKKEFLETINLNIPGIHNIYNSLAVFALSTKYINDYSIIKKGIEKYQGVERRFEFIGTYKNNIKVYDDYAHHPAEIQTTLNSLKNIKGNQNWAIFQSHTFSRTTEHLDEFVNVLKDFDNIIIAPIFPARETNIYGISEDIIVNKIKKDNKKVVYLDTFEKIVTYLKQNVQDNDLIITIGAGPVNEIGIELLK